MESLPQPESEKSPAELFNKSFEALQQLPSQEDDGRMRVAGWQDERVHFYQEGQKVITLHSPDGVHNVGVTLMDATAEMPEQDITVDIMGTSEAGPYSIASANFKPQQDPLGNTEIVAQVVTPTNVELTVGDKEFLGKIGFGEMVDSADVPATDAQDGHWKGALLATPQQIAAVGNLPQATLENN